VARTLLERSKSFVTDSEDKEKEGTRGPSDVWISSMVFQKSETTAQLENRAKEES